MLCATTRYLRDRLRQRADLVVLEYSWSFVVVAHISVVLVAFVATLQRRHFDLAPAFVADIVVLTPVVVFFVTAVRMRPVIPWIAHMVATAILLFTPPTAIPGDFAPLLLVLMVGVVGSLAPLLGGLLATASAAALLLLASAMDRLDWVSLYLAFVAIGWQVAYLVRTQQQLMVKQRHTQEKLAEHAADDERRRIAREIHDVIAHSLSVTLLHLTAARRGLQQDRDVDDAVEALQQAETLGRHAMTDIRRTVGLLDSAPMKIAPEPGVGDIAELVDDFNQAGLAVSLRISGPSERVSAAIGLALYRIVQESVANIAKHAAEAESTVNVVISRSWVKVTVFNDLPQLVPAGTCSDGRGLSGMRQRVEQLGGAIDFGPSEGGWAVRADIPLDDGEVGCWLGPRGS